MPNQTVGTGLDSDDTKGWKPKREQDASDKVPQSRDISKMISKEQKRTANPSR